MDVYKANSVNMIKLLEKLNEPLQKRGKHTKWLKHESVSFKDNMWYQHSLKRGGLPTDFLVIFFNKSYGEAIDYLNKNFDTKNYDTSKYTNSQKLIIPKSNSHNKNLIAYLQYFRFIDKKVIDYFIAKNILYEDFKYHNCVFVGKDNFNQSVHIHSTSTNKSPYDYKGIVKNSNTNFPFNLIQNSSQLFVFESPIDLMSYLTLNPADKIKHSYLALCGLSIKPLLNILKTYPHLTTINLCLDNDVAGESAKSEFKNQLTKNIKLTVNIINSKFKDFNEDLKFINHQPIIKGIRSPFYHLTNEVKDQIILNVENNKTKSLKDLFNDFSLFLYTHNSKSNKQKIKAFDALIQSATTALLLTSQHSKHLEKRSSIKKLLDKLIIEDEDFMQYVDNSKNYTKFIKNLDYLKKAFNTSFYHTKDQKNKIIKVLNDFAKKAIYTYVFLILKERNI